MYGKWFATTTNKKELPQRARAEIHEAETRYSPRPSSITKHPQRQRGNNAKQQWFTTKSFKVMKRLILMGCTLILALGVAEAQILKFGARAGLNTGVYNFDKTQFDGGYVVPAADRSGGYVVGIFTRLQIPHFIYFQPELDMLVRDVSLGIKLDDEPMEYKNIRTMRIELPVMVGFNIAAAHFFAGPVWRISTNQHYRGAGSTPFEIKFNDNDVAAMAGAAIDFEGVFMEVRYMRYLHKTEGKMKIAGQSTNVEVSNDDMLQISFGVVF